MMKLASLSSPTHSSANDFIKLLSAAKTSLPLTHHRLDESVVLGIAYKADDTMAAPAYLPTALFVALRPLFFFGRPSMFKFSAEACAILHALCWSQQHQQVCHFSSLLLLSDSRPVLATLSSPPSFLFYLKLCGRSGRNCLLSFSVLSDYHGSLVSPGERRG